MHSWVKAVAIWVVVGTGPAALYGQFSFYVKGRPVQIHSFASQGFAYSDHNNYLTMQTSRGSFAMTDLGANASFQLSDRLRIGAQVHSRNIGNLGQWHPQLDWAVADYRFKDWLGFRGGVVKTVFGLSTDTQDMEFLHTFALLPQSVYPTDLRDALIRHRGGDLYGEVPLHRLGSLSYTLYAGVRQDGMYGGYPYLLSALGGRLTSYGGLQVGQDLRWNTPLNGLLLGASHVGADIQGEGLWNFVLPGSPPGTPPVKVLSREHSNRDWTNQFFSQYAAGNWRLAAEYRRYWRDQVIQNNRYEITADTRGWYVSGSYRVCKQLEIGAYYSRWAVSWFSTLPTVVQAPSQESPDRHLYDKVVTARFDLNRHWNVKVEGHFIDGYGGVYSYPSGFYVQDNPQGLKPRTNLFLIRTGWNF
jgi:hypothetical protein